MAYNIELLAPGGSKDSIKAAIVAGADAIFCGLDRFNARNRAVNLTFNDLQGVLNFAHRRGCKVFLTLNIIVIEREVPAFIELLNRLVNISIDGIILQDLGMIDIVSRYFPTLDIHISTQATTHNKGQIGFLSDFGISRVNLARELNLEEITELTKVADRSSIGTEIFIHGSNCISFSGVCYMSSLDSGNSGNRGRCSQPCRDKYRVGSTGISYPLNMKDSSTYSSLDRLVKAGVSSLKIEGRIKSADYVYTVVNFWRDRLDGIEADSEVLYKVFNRDLSDGYINGNIGKEMFIDNPRDNSVAHLGSDSEEVVLELYREKDHIKSAVKEKIDAISIDQIPLDIEVNGRVGAELTIRIKGEGVDCRFNSRAKLAGEGREHIGSKMLLKKLKAIDDTEYRIENITVSRDLSKAYLSFSEIAYLKRRILIALNGGRDNIRAVEVEKVKSAGRVVSKGKLAILISSLDQYESIKDDSIEIYFKIPAGLSGCYDQIVEILRPRADLLLWFPSIMIGDDYLAAVKLIKEIAPRLIVTDNSGIAVEASASGISWIAGPSFNIVNSYAIEALRDRFNCQGVFLSSELNREQLRSITDPIGVELCYSIYHPIRLMTTRQCVIQQTEGCYKDIIDRDCIDSCSRSSSIVDKRGRSILVDKRIGDITTLYNDKSYLNLEIIDDIPDTFSRFFIEIKEFDREEEINIGDMITLFSKAIDGDQYAIESLYKMINLTTNKQYRKGI